MLLLNSNTPEDYFNLIDNSSFWIDWEIDQIFNDKDLTKSEIFQSVISSLVKLLSKLPQSSTRTHYLQKVAEQLSLTFKQSQSLFKYCAYHQLLNINIEQPLGLSSKVVLL